MNKNFVAILVGVVLLMIGVFVLGGGKQSNEDVAFEGNPREVQASDWAQGPDDAAVTLIEYGDFECPACAAFFPIIGAAKIEFGDDLRFAFRHFPLTNIHPNANAAHRAAEAAGNQGMFFEMHDLLYERQQSWSAGTSGLSTTQAISLFETYAEELGLDMDQYRQDVNGDEVFEVITSHLDSGNQINVASTPTMLLNGEIIDNPTDAGAFFDLLRDEINKAKGITPDESEGDNTDQSGSDEEALPPPDEEEEE